MGLRKYSDFINMNEKTLQDDLKDAQSRHQKLKFEHKVKGLSDPTQISKLRKEIAQMSTEIRKRHLASANITQ